MCIPVLFNVYSNIMHLYKRLKNVHFVSVIVGHIPVVMYLCKRFQWWINLKLVFWSQPNRHWWLFSISLDCRYDEYVGFSASAANNRAEAFYLISFAVIVMYDVGVSVVVFLSNSARPSYEQSVHFIVTFFYVHHRQENTHKNSMCRCH